eukprot:g1479.t1
MAAFTKLNFLWTTAKSVASAATGVLIPGAALALQSDEESESESEEDGEEAEGEQEEAEGGASSEPRQPTPRGARDGASLEDVPANELFLEDLDRESGGGDNDDAKSDDDGSNSSGGGGGGSSSSISNEDGDDSGGGGSSNDNDDSSSSSSSNGDDEYTTAEGSGWETPNGPPGFQGVCPACAADDAAVQRGALEGCQKCRPVWITVEEYENDARVAMERASETVAAEESEQLQQQSGQLRYCYYHGEAVGLGVTKAPEERREESERGGDGAGSEGRVPTDAGAPRTQVGSQAASIGTDAGRAVEQVPVAGIVSKASRSPRVNEADEAAAHAEVAGTPRDDRQQSPRFVPLVPLLCEEQDQQEEEKKHQRQPSDPEHEIDVETARQDLGHAMAAPSEQKGQEEVSVFQDSASSNPCFDNAAEEAENPNKLMSVVEEQEATQQGESLSTQAQQLLQQGKRGPPNAQEGGEKKSKRRNPPRPAEHDEKADKGEPRNSPPRSQPAMPPLRSASAVGGHAKEQGLKIPPPRAGKERVGQASTGAKNPAEATTAARQGAAVPGAAARAAAPAHEAAVRVGTAVGAAVGAGTKGCFNLGSRKLDSKDAAVGPAKETPVEQRVGQAAAAAEGGETGDNNRPFLSRAERRAAERQRARERAKAARAARLERHLKAQKKNNPRRVVEGQLLAGSPKAAPTAPAEVKAKPETLNKPPQGPAAAKQGPGGGGGGRGGGGAGRGGNSGATLASNRAAKGEGVGKECKAGPVTNLCPDVTAGAAAAVKAPATKAGHFLANDGTAGKANNERFSEEVLAGAKKVTAAPKKQADAARAQVDADEREFAGMMKRLAGACFAASPAGTPSRGGTTRTPLTSAKDHRDNAGSLSAMVYALRGAVSAESEGWTWPAVDAPGGGESGRAGEGGVRGPRGHGNVAVAKPLRRFAWIGRAAAVGGKLEHPWGNWKRWRQPEKWEKMVGAALTRYSTIIVAADFCATSERERQKLIAAFGGLDEDHLLRVAKAVRERVLPGGSPDQLIWKIMSTNDVTLLRHLNALIRQVREWRGP